MEIVLRTNAVGQAMTAPVFWCHGRNPRPLAYLQANVHGGELQGNAAILALFDLLEKEPPRGSLILVPRVNPVAANQQIGDYVAGVYDLATASTSTGDTSTSRAPRGEAAPATSTWTRSPRCIATRRSRRFATASARP